MSIRHAADFATFPSAILNASLVLSNDWVDNDRPIEPSGCIANGCHQGRRVSGSTTLPARIRTDSSLLTPISADRFEVDI
ncbi:MAG: hypothetical protein ACK5Q5_01705 [Planctomycetaceae bacterium]